MNYNKPLVLIIMLLLCALALGGCLSETQGGTGEKITVRVVATQDFGQELVFDEMLEVPTGTSAMAALKQVAEVKTAYGGGFVNAINDVPHQHAKGDWFVSANGITTNVGAAYTLHDGDIEHWDFHNWSFRMFIPAIIGDFPEPFLHGYGGRIYPTVIAYEKGLERSAKDLEIGLKRLGVTNVSTRNIDDLTGGDKQHSNLILVCTADCDLVSELNQVWGRMGFFVHFENGAMVVYNSKGEATAEYGAGSGVIQATQSPWNPGGIGVCQNVVWMVSGIDEAGVKAAADALINGHDQFKYAYAIVVAESNMIKVPQ